MKNIRIAVATLAISSSLSLQAMESATSINYYQEPTTQIYPQTLPVTTTTPTTTTTTTTTTKATTSTSTSTSSTTTSGDPQYNINDVKVTSSGKCEVRKGGTVIMTGEFQGSPCQKIYGNNMVTQSSTTSNPWSTTHDQYDTSTLEVAAPYNSLYQMEGQYLNYDRSTMDSNW